MAAEQEDRQKINARFDDELSRLKNMWNPPNGAP